MNPPAASQGAVAFFLPLADGQRFCLYHRPAPGQACRGALVYVPPFAEEMNRARRMAALQARAFADAGIGVLILDLYGCGDSSGDLAEARWDLWLADVAAARRWLQQELQRPAGLWGLRLGATLALAAARQADEPVPDLLLCNPVLDGSSFLNQFLRLRLAGDMLSPSTGARASVTSLRAQLAAGDTLEIAGYPLSPALAAAIDAIDVGGEPPHAQRTHWIELLREGLSMPERAAQLARAWQPQVSLHTLSGAAYWSNPEVMANPALVALGCRLLTSAP